MSDGDFYDRCPQDGCLEVDTSHKSEGVPISAERQSQHEWDIFSADRRKGGCGAVWTRTNAQGVARDAERGIDSVRLTRSAEAGRAYSLPSEQFRSQYERIFGHA